MALRECIDKWAQNRVVLVVVLMGTYSVQSLLITASKKDDSFAYDASAVVFLTEGVKLIFALAMLTPGARRALNPLASLPYSAPAVLYTLQNRLVFEALRYISPPEYQLLNNMKLFTTSILYRVVMRRQLRLLQWMALVLLALGMAVANQPAPGATGSEKTSVSSTVWSGASIMFIVAWCSAGGGVVNEWLIKRSANNIEANVWLYSYGMVAAGLQLGVAGWGRLLRLEGFTLMTWAVVLCNAVLGQSIAFLFRYADSIVKLYAVCAAMAFTTLASVLFFGFEIHFHMLAGYIISAISVSMYYAPPEYLQMTDVDMVASVCASRHAASKKA